MDKKTRSISVEAYRTTEGAPISGKKQTARNIEKESHIWPHGHTQVAGRLYEEAHLCYTNSMNKCMNSPQACRQIGNQT